MGKSKSETPFDERVEEQRRVVRDAFEAYRKGDATVSQTFSYKEYANWLEMNFAIMRVLLDQLKHKHDNHGAT